jgi:3-methyladenine DNA glycosylase AlkC
MAEPLKLFFDAELVRSLASDFARAHRPFRREAFVRACLERLDELELTQRAWHIAEAMAAYLPRPYGAAARVILASLGPEHGSSSEFGMGPFRYLPHVFFVQKFGLDDFELSMHLQYELTKRLSAESSIRAYLVRYPRETHARLRDWARDANTHVRRLVSEGTRPRLPWAPRLRDFQRDPGPVLELLELLKDDPERYVQRSVANNLNDIGKDHPDLVVAVCRKWSKRPTPGRSFIVKHALRSLVKRGHRGALETLGAGKKPSVRLAGVNLARSVRIGEKLRFSCVLANTAKAAQDLLVDFAVHFVKANGARSAKVFKLRRVVLERGASTELSGRVSFIDMTTRKHHAGRHRIELLINGERLPLGEFDVRKPLAAGAFG